MSCYQAPSTNMKCSHSFTDNPQSHILPTSCYQAPSANIKCSHSFTYNPQSHTLPTSCYQAPSANIKCSHSFTYNPQSHTLSALTQHISLINHCIVTHPPLSLVHPYFFPSQPILYARAHLAPHFVSQQP